MKVLFIENHLNVRGTTLALYDYAHFNETILGNTSIIATRPYSLIKSDDISTEIYDKFEKRFPVFYFSSPNQIQSIIDAEKPDWVYVLKGGNRDGYDHFENVKTLIHCAGPPSQPHGNVYCTISEWNNQKVQDKAPVLPHIIDLPKVDEDLREKLNIPKDATVFGRIGGWEAFDNPAAQAAVERVSREHPETYFLFVHTKPFCSSRNNIIHLQAITDPVEKTKFINTCDAMIYGREMGESFGIAIGEFSIRNKPIITSEVDRHGNPMIDRMHRMILGENAYWYRTAEDCVQHMLNFNREEAKTKDWNMYRQYSPENVMKIFQALITPPKRKIGLYVIHDPLKTEREQAYKTVEKAINIDAQIIWYKSASGLTEEDQKRFGGNLRDTEKSLILNHEYALKCFVESDYEYAFIVEDDSYVINEKVLKRFAQVIEQHQITFDTVYVGPGCFTEGYNYPLDGKDFVLVPHPGSRCTEFIAYSREGARTTLEGFNQMIRIDKPLDHILPTRVKLDYKNYHLHPYPVIQGTGTGMFKSSIR